MWLLYNIEILRALRVKSSYAFLKRPPDSSWIKIADISQIPNAFIFLSIIGPYEMGHNL